MTPRGQRRLLSHLEAPDGPRSRRDGVRGEEKAWFNPTKCANSVPRDPKHRCTTQTF